MENFCLKWSEFETNMRDSFRELRANQDHFDVTLATDDDYQIQAHKIILSAGSEFFSKILAKTKHPSPFIYLKGIRRIELENIVDFLYNGETNVAQDELNRFLEAAQELQVKGLQSNEHILENRNDQKKKQNVGPNVMEKESKCDIGKYLDSPSGIIDSCKEVANTFDNGDFPVDQIIDEGFISQDPGLDLQTEQMCGKTDKENGQVKIHTGTHSYACHICNTTSTTSVGLRQHILDFHSGVFNCDICGKSWTSRNAFHKHNRRNHKLTNVLQGCFCIHLGSVKT